MLKAYHPYNPGYSYPANVFADDEHRVETTKPLLRRTVDVQPWYPKNHPWSSGYAVPEYMKTEDPGDAMWSRPLRRRTVDYLYEDSMRKGLPGTGGIVADYLPVIAILGVAALFMWRKK